MAQFATKAPPGMYFETGGVSFLGRNRFAEATKPSRSKSPSIVFSLDWDGRNAIYPRSHLDAVVQQISRCNESAGGRAVIEASAAVLAVISLAIFAAHALDAYRTG